MDEYFGRSFSVDSTARAFQRCSVSEVIQDVFDGDEYKKHMPFLSEPNNISLTCNYDGVAMFRSSTVDELPMKKR